MIVDRCLRIYVPKSLANLLVDVNLAIYRACYMRRNDWSSALGRLTLYAFDGC